MKPLILICPRNVDIYLLLTHILNVDGFRTVLASEEEVVEKAAAMKPDVIILDTGTDAASTLRTCATIRSNEVTAAIPTIALVAAGDERHYLDLLKAGVDENFVRPVLPIRLLNYLHSLSMLPARTAPAQPRSADTLEFGGLKIHVGRRQVKYEGRELQLGPIEFKLLSRLLEAPGNVFTRQQLIEVAWPPNLYVQSRTVDVHIGHLRRSLRRLTGGNLIRTVRASGYAVELNSSTADVDRCNTAKTEIRGF
ncbi:response regulator transcription factor [Ensifer sp. HO-A22]|uniref:Response regulator transcription factor n=1 Tax=Ensifer oleiphilus TaxID=2742698 RepID=A0A7Y6UMT6_9HYPH|nr:response regulator transcription factor [Ensifer oleiphilus]NVD39751.1 response regulator transcription factor [Ensifer oleiphilus]